MDFQTFWNRLFPRFRPASSKSQRPHRHRRRLETERLEERNLLATYIVDATFSANNLPAGEFTTLQAALKQAAITPAGDQIYVFGNNQGKEYLWTSGIPGISDQNGDGLDDGNMVIPVGDTIVFRAETRVANPADPNQADVAAPLIVKMANNIIDVQTDAVMRVEGRSVFTTPPPAPVVTPSRTYSRFPNKVIADGSEITAPLTVPDSFSISDLNVSVNIDHPRVKELRVQLVYQITKKKAIKITLVPRGIGANGTSFRLVLDDQAARSIYSASPTFPKGPVVGTYAPAQPLARFNGLPGNRQWKLVVKDMVRGNQTRPGRLKSWSLRFESPQFPVIPPPPPVPVSFPVTFTSVRDDANGGDTNGDGQSVGSPGDWGGIRFQSGAADQGSSDPAVFPSTGALIDNAVISYAGQKIGDVQYHAVRMDADGIAAAQPRLQNTLFPNNFEAALGADMRALGAAGAGDVVTGPLLRNLTFANNSINGLRILVPRTDGALDALNVPSQWDDVGVTYVLTQNLTVTAPFTIDAGMVVKLQLTTQIDVRSGELYVNGTANQAVVLTTLQDDSAGGDTNNNGAGTPVLEDFWGGLLVSRGNVDYARISFAGNQVQLADGNFFDRPPLTIDTGLPDRFRLANSEIRSSSGGGPLGQPRRILDIRGAGEISIIDNHIHDNNADVAGGLAIWTDGVLASVYNDRPHPLGGYGIHFRRNVLSKNDIDAVFTSVLTTQFAPNGYLDDTDIVQVIGSRIDVNTSNDTLQLLTRRTVRPNNGAQEAFSGGAAAQQDFTGRLQAQGAFQIGTGTDNGLFYRFIDFETVPRDRDRNGAPDAPPAQLQGDEWRDFGVNLSTPLASVPTSGDAMTPVSGARLLTTNQGNGSLTMAFPNPVTALGFWVVDNETTNAGERISFFGIGGNLIESIPLPTTAGGPVFIGRINDLPISRVEITEDPGDSAGGVADLLGIDDLYFVEGEQSLVVKAANNATIHAGGWDGQSLNGAGRFVVGPTLRILGQTRSPVFLTSLADDSRGGDTNGDGAATTALAGNWTGIRLLGGVNTSRVDNTDQLTGQRTYSDRNPYTIGDDAGSDLETLSVDPLNPAPLAAADADGDITNGLQQNLQDGTLIEHADIRFAVVGIDTGVYPDGDLAIEANERETITGETNNSPGTAEKLPPIARLVSGALIPQTFTGAVRAGGAATTLASGANEDWYELGDDRNATFYIDVDHTGDDAAATGNVSIWVFNASNQLVYFNTRQPPILYVPAGGANYLGPITMFPGNAPYTADPNQRFHDAHYVVVTGNGRVPEVLTNIGGVDQDKPTFTPLDPTDPTSGYLVNWFGSTGALVAIPQNANFVGFGAGVGAGVNSATDGYEMEVREPRFVSGVDIHRGREGNAIRAMEGEIILRKNRVSNFSTTGINLQDAVVQTQANPTIVPAQGARYAFRNAALSPTSSQFSNPNHMLPGVQVYNNLVIDGQGDGIRTGETFSAVGDVPLGNHLIINNTVHNNAGAGILAETDGGPTITNNIVTNNAIGINVVDPNPGRFDQAVAAFNLAFGNTTSQYTGTFQGGTTNRVANPLYVNAAGGDFRLQSNSPAIDAAQSDSPDRLGTARAPERTWAPEDDFQDRKRQDAPTADVGVGIHPFWDIGAFEFEVTI